MDPLAQLASEVPGASDAMSEKRERKQVNYNEKALGNEERPMHTDFAGNAGQGNLSDAASSGQSRDSAVELLESDDEDGGAAPPRPATGPRKRASSGAGGRKRQRAEAAAGPAVVGATTVQLTDTNGGSSVSVKRSMRIAKLEGEKQKDAIVVELEKERAQQMQLHSRIANLLKKVEHMDKLKSAAEEKAKAAKDAADDRVREAKREAQAATKSARMAKNTKTSVNIDHLAELSSKDKEIAQLSKKLKKLEGTAGPTRASSAPKDAGLSKQMAASEKRAASAEAQLAKATADKQQATTANKELRATNKELASQAKSLKTELIAAAAAAAATESPASAQPASGAAVSELDAQVQALTDQLAAEQTSGRKAAAAASSKVKAAEKKAEDARADMKAAEKKRDLTEQRRCDMLLAHGKMETELELLQSGLRQLDMEQGMPGAASVVPSAFATALQPIATAISSRDEELARLQERSVLSPGVAHLPP